MAKDEIYVRGLVNCFTGREWRQKTFKLPKEEQGLYNQKRFMVDGWNEEIGDGVVWEYDGAGHYTDIRAINKDKKRNEYFKSKKIKVVIIPFYCVGFSESFVRAYFRESLFKTQEELEVAIKKNQKKLDSTPCGWSGTSNKIRRFHEEGKKRFLEEMKGLPEDVRHQVIYSIRLDAVQTVLLLNDEYKKLHSNSPDYKITATQEEIKKLIHDTDINKKYYEGRSFPLDR